MGDYVILYNSRTDGVAVIAKDKINENGQIDLQKIRNEFEDYLEMGFIVPENYDELAEIKLNFLKAKVGICINV